MTHIAPAPIELIESEAKLWAQISAKATHDEWPNIADAMEALMSSLAERNAIPTLRWKMFADPAFAETGTKSPLQIFQGNGTRGANIFRHGNFIPYLRYLIEGPGLPKEARDGLCKILNDDNGPSGEVMKQYQKFAREVVRKNHLSPGVAATEFFRLGVEVGMGLNDARILRNAARSTK